MKKRSLITAAAGALAATALAGGIAIAAIPSAGGVIHGCYRQNEGVLRVIDAETQACRHSEVPISWNRVGPQGAQGPQGEQGSAGEDGADGVDGRNGTDGQDGVSVTSAVEPAGANCSNGGSRFTAANGTTYACNGADSTPGATATLFPVLTLQVSAPPSTATFADLPGFGRLAARCGIGPTGSARAFLRFNNTSDAHLEIFLGSRGHSPAVAGGSSGESVYDRPLTERWVISSPPGTSVAASPYVVLEISIIFWGPSDAVKCSFYATATRS